MGKTKIKPLYIFILCILMTVLVYMHTDGSIKELILRCRLRKTKPHIILIVVDALRADHLSCYGYKRNTSPNIDKFTKDSVLFRNAFSQYPGTVTSLASMLTGLYPNTHRAKLAIDSHTLETLSIVPIDNKLTTLAEIIKDYGYLTLGFVSSPLWLNNQLGFEQGFEHFYAIPGYADILNKNVYEVIGKFKEKKLFLFMHYIDVHSDSNRLPYEAPYPYSEMFTANYKGNFRGGEEDVWASLYLAQCNLKRRHSLSKVDICYIVDLYDQGIAYMDSEIGNLFNFLKKNGLYGDSLIIITSDHGEAFWEHGNFLHNTLYDEIMHVPLIIKFPHQLFRGREVNSLVEGIDIFPSILRLLNISVPESVQGKEFLSVILRDRRGKNYVFAGKDGFSMIRTQDIKLICHGNRIEFYNLDLDPDELNNVTNKKDIEMLRLYYMLDKWNRETLSAGSVVKTNGVNSNKKQVDTLRSLGYLH